MKLVIVSATLLLVAMGCGRAAAGAAVTGDRLCYNVNLMTHGDWTAPDLVEAVLGSGASVLRLPGGTIGDYWDWDAGGLNRQAMRMPRRGEIPGLEVPGAAQRRADMNEVAGLLDATDTTALWTMNTLTSDIDKEVRHIRAALERGIDITAIAIGNEPYFQTPNMRTRYASAEAFAALASNWAHRLSRDFPGIPIGIPVGRADRPQELTEWVGAVRGASPPEGVALIVHPYLGYDRKKLELTNEGASAFLATTRKRHDRMMDMIEHAAGKGVWVTEYNFVSPGSEPSPLGGSWIQAMANGMRLMDMLKREVEFACLHVLTGLHDWQALSLSGERYAPGPQAVMQAMVREAIDPIAEIEEMSPWEWRLLKPGGEVWVIMNPASVSLSVVQRSGTVLSGAPWGNTVNRSEGEISLMPPFSVFVSSPR